MAQNVENMNLEVLKSIQTSMADIRSSITDMRSSLERLEASSARQRRDSAGMLVMMRSTVGHYAGELAELKARVAVLEQRDSL